MPTHQRHAGHNPRIAVTRTVPGQLDIPGAQIDILSEDLPKRDALLKFVPGAAILVSMYTERVDKELLEAAGDQLRGVCNFAVGVNNIDLEACARRGVIVTNTPDAVTEGTADMAWLLTLAVARKLIEADRYARSAAYPHQGPLGMADFMGLDLTGRTVLIIGAGRIGFATAMRAKAWGMKILYVARTKHWNFDLAPLAAERVGLDEGLALADVVSIHTPLTPDTTHLLDERRLGLLKPTAIVVNTSRGPVIDEHALAEALHAGQLWGAGLDVFEREPEIHPDLLTAPNTVLTPHIGSAEARFRLMMTAMVAENARAILNDTCPPNQVTA
jgi:glyoxylate reductase